jgi:hypothetical protein
MNSTLRIKHLATVMALAIVAALASSLAGAASSGPSSAPVSYEPRSSYVIGPSGQRLGVLTGDGLNVEFVTASGQRAS